MTADEREGKTAMGDGDRREKDGGALGIDQEIADAEAAAKASQQKLQDLKLQRVGLKVTEFPVDVTICVPVFNAITTLGRALWSVSKHNQTIPANLVLADNGSTDPGADVLVGQKIVQWCEKTLGFKQVTVLSPTPQTTHDTKSGKALQGQARKNVNVEFIRKKLSVAVSTPLMMYLDADVEAPYDALRLLKEKLDSDEQTALVGILYVDKVDHVQAGCTMGRTTIIQDVNWHSMGCSCRWLTKYLTEQGHKVEYLDPREHTAVHLDRWKLK